MSQHLYTFRKPEHLCLKTEIEALFGAGNTSMSAFPLRITYRKLPYTGQGPQVKVLLSVSKRHFKHAVDRNRAKRQIREAYRLQNTHCSMPCQLIWHYTLPLSGCQTIRYLRRSLAVACTQP